MTVNFSIDVRPYTVYTVLFSGSIEIGRMDGPDGVAIYGASDDAKVWGVAVNAKETNRRKDELWFEFKQMTDELCTDELCTDGLWHGCSPFYRIPAVPLDGLYENA